MAASDASVPEEQHTDRSDELAVDRSAGSLLVCNYGDVAFLKEIQFPEGLLRHEVIFLRLLSYLAFIDEVAVPGRLILDSEPLMQAIELATPLLRAGIVRPEKRSTVASFSDLASARQLGPLGRERAERLDEISKKPRLFRFDHLQKTYRDILLQDLAVDGAFRTTISGARKGKRAGLLDRSHADYAQHGDGTPENFAQIVGRHAPRLFQKALRWAMARYYLTPTLFDDRNMREIPRPAAELLLSARAKEEMNLPEPTIAPVDLLFQRLSVSLPAHRVTLDAERYCEAIQKLRDSIPEARRVSRTILQATEAHAVSREVSEVFAKELRRQQHVVAHEPGHLKFVTGSALVGALFGAIGDIFVGIPGTVSIPVGTATGVAAEVLQKKRDRARRQRESPWVVAVGLFDETSKDPG